MFTHRPLPTVLHVLPHDGLSHPELALAITLQGLLNTKEPTILLRTGRGSYGRILESNLRRQGVAFVESSSVWELLKRFPGQVSGGIRFRLGTPSLSAATSLCSLHNAVAVDDTLVERAEKEGVKILHDVRDWDDRRTLKEVGHRFTRGIAVEQGIDKMGHLRDFAVSNRAFTFAAGTDNAFRQEVVKRFGPDAMVYGWGPDEYQWVCDLSKSNGTGIPADWAQNLSLLQKLPEPKLVRPRRPELVPEEGTHYISFVLSDGDNIQWSTGGFIEDKKYWGSPLRGTFPMTWEVAPILAKVAPGVLAHLYATAKSNDGFVTGAGLTGYTFPHYQTDRLSIAKQADPILRAADLPFISVLNANEGRQEDTDALLAQRSVSACLYKDYAPYHRSQGRIVWMHGKPCVAYRGLLWEGLMSPEEVAKLVAPLPKSPRTNADSYTFINVHAWSYDKIGGPMEAIRQTIALLPSHVRVVTADQALAAMGKYCRKG